MKASLFAAVLFSACSSGPPEPLDPVWGKQACDHCAMLISDSHSAAQAVYADGARRFFDDVGCLAAWLNRAPEAPAALWVRTADDRGWTAAAGAHFSSGNVTPMDFGFLPAPEGVSFEELRATVKSKTEAPGGTP